MKTLSMAFLTVMFVLAGGVGWSEEPEGDTNRFFGLKDVFELEFASDPQISPDGAQVVYVRNFMDIMTDRRRSERRNKCKKILRFVRKIATQTNSEQTNFHLLGKSALHRFDMLALRRGVIFRFLQKCRKLTHNAVHRR